MTYRDIPDEVRRAAVADFRAGDNYTTVANRYGIARSTLKGWLVTTADDIGLAGGRWVPNGRGVQVWQPFVAPTRVDLTDRERRIEWEDRMFDDDESRDMHARYFNGCREPRTVIGERVYQRRKKRKQAANRRAA